jgi:hypothetical protein
VAKRGLRQDFHKGYKVDMANFEKENEIFHAVHGARLRTGSPADRLAAKSSGDDSPRGADTAFHFETGKPMVDQVPPEAILAVAEVFTYGVNKYGHFNWQHHADQWTYNQLYASMQRHVLAWQAGEDTDPESGLPHLAHAACNLMMLLTLIAHDKGKDDRGPLAKEKP